MAMKKTEKNNPTGQKLSEKYGGKLPANIADELQAFVTQSREELIDVRLNAIAEDPGRLRPIQELFDELDKKD